MDTVTAKSARRTFSCYMLTMTGDWAFSRTQDTTVSLGSLTSTIWTPRYMHNATGGFAWCIDTCYTTLTTASYILCRDISLGTYTDAP
ncbi:hypothetical protein PoB_003572700 [Plakobranchus ocellatus]|uniref:Uncharacterized protein n=1 Tax=Plakobranchus ocellatus TaxID=259542 RepID=A0AAV4AQK9_9GAST|nr:hypothetical protein PoB_003572700 [Plakobranchus ocellatus]